MMEWGALPSNIKPFHQIYSKQNPSSHIKYPNHPPPPKKRAEHRSGVHVTSPPRVASPATFPAQRPAPFFFTTTSITLGEKQERHQLVYLLFLFGGNWHVGQVVGLKSGTWVFVSLLIACQRHPSRDSFDNYPSLSCLGKYSFWNSQSILILGGWRIACTVIISDSLKADTERYRLNRL